MLTALRHGPVLEKSVFRNAISCCKFSCGRFSSQSLVSFSTLGGNARKKDVSGKLPQTYEPSDVECGWYQWWEREDFFRMQSRTNSRPFTMILPPPNVTGTLHLGHALTVTVQDVIARWRHMCGQEVIWIPGTDHAGIATQLVVEKQLWAQQKVTRHDLGRDKFLEQVFSWQKEKGSSIQDQLRMMGASLNWSKEYFTMDEKQSAAVVEAFIRLFDEGLIYRSHLPVSWSCWLQSTISDIEIDNLEVNGPTAIQVPGYENHVQFGTLTNIVYKNSEGDQRIVVSTTRPETMLGDVAVAVHPDDHRFSHLRGSYFWHPYRNESIPLIFDNFVDRDFGTGAVKITPAHNKVDFEVAKRHNLELIPVINEQGIIEDNFDSFKGMRRFNAREAIVNDLLNRGLIEEIKPHHMTIPICCRSGDVIELLPKPQWFLSTKDMAQSAINAVKDGELRFLPKNAEEQWYQWFEKNQDWCLSRQLWWGHRIPAYNCSLSDGSHHIWIAARNESEAKAKASSHFSCHSDDPKLSTVQDEDVLDTWFSSSLLPFSALGWPVEGNNFKNQYPLSLMETGNDILLFWVARMVMLGQHLTKQIPFKDVVLHGIIRDSSGRKMSKSIGNVIAPEDVRDGRSLEDLKEQLVHSQKLGIIPASELKNSLKNQQMMFPNGIPRCGTDALRIYLCSLPIDSQFIDFDVNDCYTFRLFCNKIWQACRYVDGVMDRFDDKISLKLENHLSLSIMDLWILSKFSNLVSSLNEQMGDVSLFNCVQNLKTFAHHEFCDVYLESTKFTLAGDDLEAIKTTKTVLSVCIGNLLAVLSPFMPFLTEELYHRISYIQKKYSSVTLYPYPQPKDWACWKNSKLEEEIECILLAVTAIRKLKKNNGFRKADNASVTISTDEENEVGIFLKHQTLLEKFAGCDVLKVSEEKGNFSGDIMTEERLKTSCLIKINLQDENQRLLSYKHRQDLIRSAVRKQIKLEKDISKTRTILESTKFWTNAPEDVKKTLPKKLAIFEGEMKKVETFLNQEPELRDNLRRSLSNEKPCKKRTKD